MNCLNCRIDPNRGKVTKRLNVSNCFFVFLRWLRSCLKYILRHICQHCWQQVLLLSYLLDTFEIFLEFSWVINIHVLKLCKHHSSSPISSPKWKIYGMWVDAIIQDQISSNLHLWLTTNISRWISECKINQDSF